METPIVTFGIADGRDIPRDERIQGFLDLELGPESKWVLVYRDDSGRSFFTAPATRVAPMEAAEVLQTMGKGLAAAIEKMRKEKR